MKRSYIAIALLVLVLSVSAITGASALTSPSYDLVNDSLRGGNPSGGLVTSESYILLTGFGGMLDTSISSANYQLCSGYVCDTDIRFVRVFLPEIQR